MSIDFSQASSAIRAGLAKSKAINKKMCLAVADAEGNLLVFTRMPGAWLGSIDVAINKAWTSAAFATATSALAKEAAPGGQFHGIQHSNGGKVMIFAGGLPVKDDDGKVIGAVGVSGGSGEEDESVASAMVKAMTNEENV